MRRREHTVRQRLAGHGAELRWSSSLHRRELERITGSAADGSQLLAQAGRTATTAAGLVQTDPGLMAAG